MIKYLYNRLCAEVEKMHYVDDEIEKILNEDGGAG